jgi:hypothetical protein
VRYLLFWLAMLVSVASYAQVATPTRKGVIQLGAGLSGNPTTGVTSVSIVRTNLGQGMLYDLGSKKELYVTTTVNASSKVVINLTLDNTATGTAIFSTVLHATLTGWVTGTSANDVIILTLEPWSTGSKVLTGRAAKGSTVLVGTTQTLANVPAGTQVTIAVHGY